MWPHLQRPEKSAEAAVGRRTRTMPLVLDEVREIVESSLRRAPRRARTRELRLLFSS